MRKNNKSNILATIILIVLTITLTCIATKIISTSIELAIIKTNIEDYNQTAIKTDKRTEEIRDEFERREEIYQSDDIIVRIFSNQHISIKILIFLLANFYYFWLVNIIKVRIEKIQKRKKAIQSRKSKEKVQRKYKNFY